MHVVVNTYMYMGIFYSCTVTEVMKTHATVWWVYHNMREYIGMHPPNSWAFTID